ncbi:Cytochrome P450 [Penicillium brevicompactum]
MEVILEILSLITFRFILGWSLLVTASALLYRVLTDPLSKVPGPFISKLTGIVDTFYYVRGYRHEYVHSLHEKYGPIVRYAPGHVNISDIGAVHTIHKLDRGYIKGKWYLSLAPPGVWTLMNITDPRMHTRWRRLLGGPFQDSYLQKLEPVVWEKMSLALGKMEEQLEEHGHIDVLKWWIYMALDIITELSYGTSVNILRGEEESRYIIEYLEGLGPVHAVRTTMPWVVAIAARLKLPIFNKLLNAGPRAAIWAQRTLDAYKRLLWEADPKPTLFTPLFNNGDKGFKDEQIKNLAGSNITAGSHTTATVMTFAVWAICKHPEVRDKLVAEISMLSDGFKHSDVRSLPYLNCVIRESVRLYAAVPSVLPREVPPEGAQFLGFFIPGGATVSTQCYSLHRSHKFDPDRWISPTKEMEEAYMGFGAGTRSCIGINLAHTELRLGISNFFRKFPTAVVSTDGGMSDLDMRQRAWVFMTPVGHKCLIGVQ